MRILRNVLEYADDAIITRLSLGDGGQRASDDLLSTEAPHRFRLGEDYCLGTRQSRSRKHWQLEDLEDVIVGRHIILGHRRLAVLQEDRLRAEDVPDSFDLRKILFDAILRDVSRHLAENRTAAVGIRIPRLQLVCVFGVRQPLIVTLFVPDVEQDQDACRHADGETGDVDDRIGLVLGKRANRDRPVIPPHRISPLISQK